MYGKHLFYIISVALLFNILIFKIDSPLWDDWTLENMSFDEISYQFRGNGQFYSGTTQLHEFINFVDGNKVWFSRLISLLCLAVFPCLYYRIMIQLNFDPGKALIIAIISIIIPVFGNSFGQIVLPYLIRLNFFLIGIIFINKYLFGKNKGTLYLLFSFFFFVLSYPTNSFLVFSLAVNTIILTHYYLKTRSIRKVIRTSILIFCSIIIFSVFKYILFVPDPNNIYSVAGYNTFNVEDLISNGPHDMIKYCLGYPINFMKGAFRIFSNIINIYLFLLIGILTSTFVYLKLGKYILKISRKENLALFLVGIFLLLSAIYPYAVVGKFSDDIFSYNERHNLLVPFGMSLILYGLICLSVNPKYTIYVFAILISFAFVIRINIIGFYIYKSDLQKSFRDKISSYINQNGIENQSIIFINKTDKIPSLVDWSFYEYGGIIRALGLPENKVFVTPKYVEQDSTHQEKLNIKDNTYYFIKSPNYSIHDFDTLDYRILTYELKVNKINYGYVKEVFTNNAEIELKINDIEINK